MTLSAIALLVALLFTCPGFSNFKVDESLLEAYGNRKFTWVPSADANYLLVEITRSIDGSKKGKRRLLTSASFIEKLPIEQATVLKNDRVDEYALISFRIVHRWKEADFSFETTEGSSDSLRIIVNGRRTKELTPKNHLLEYKISPISETEAMKYLLDQNEIGIDVYMDRLKKTGFIDLVETKTTESIAPQ